MFYHLWGWEDHIRTLIRTIKLLKPIPGSTLFGWQMGATPAAEINRDLSQNRLSQHKLMYLHDESSWRKMWVEVEAQTETKWRVEARAIVTPEITQRQQEMLHPEGTTLHAIFFSMVRI